MLLMEVHGLLIWPNRNPLDPRLKGLIRDPAVMFDCSPPTSPPGIQVPPPARRTQQNVISQMRRQENLKTDPAEGMGAGQVPGVPADSPADMTLAVITESLQQGSSHH